MKYIKTFDNFDGNIVVKQREDENYDIFFEGELVLENIYDFYDVGEMSYIEIMKTEDDCFEEIFLRDVEKMTTCKICSCKLSANDQNDMCDNCYNGGDEKCHSDL
jgi:hypothetical protein